jgi:MFS family permease
VTGPVPAAVAYPPPGQARIVLFGVLLALVLGPLSQNIVSPALPTIALDLGDLRHTHWIVTAYLAAGTAATPIFGKLCDTWGRRRTLALALVLFIAGSVGCALSPSLPALVGARVIQGAGGGALNALILTILADIIPPSERGRYQGYTTTVFAVGALSGPAFGGFITQHFHWSAVFWVCGGLGVLALLLGMMVLRRHPRFERPAPLDGVAALLLIAATATLLLAIGADWPGPMTGLLAASLSLWALLWWRLGRSPHPLVPIHVLASPIMRTATLSASLSTAVLFVLTTFLPAYFQQALGLSVGQAGVALSPMILGSVLGSLIAGQSMMRLKRYRRAAEAGLAVGILAAAGLVFLAMNRSPPIVLVEILLTLITLGSGTVIPITTFSIQNVMEMHDLGTATSVNNFVRQLVAAVAVPIVSVVVFGGASRSVVVASSGAYVAMFAVIAALLIASLLALWRMEERPLRST